MRQVMHSIRQSGIMLIEALIGLLLFSIGLIALMGLQANALATMGESKYRAEASFVTDGLIADMRADTAYVAAYNRVNPTRMDFPLLASGGNANPYTMTASSSALTDPDSGHPPVPSTTASVPMKGLALNLAQKTLAENQARAAYKFQHAVLDLPGGQKPVVEIIPCKKSAPDARCPDVVDSASPLNVEDYGAIVHITLEWRMPNAPANSKMRKHETWAYVLAENFQ